MDPKEQAESLRRFTAISTLVMTLVAAILAPLASFAAGVSKEDMKEPMAAQLAQRSGDEFEATFLAFMVHHHRDAAGLAELAQAKSQNGDVKRMASQMTKAEEAQIQQMTTWLKQWHNKVPYDYGMPTDSVNIVLQDTLALRSVEGDAFDKAFCEVMARHHAGAIEMARQASEKAPHQEVKELARKIEQGQSEERETLVKMRGAQSGRAAERNGG